MAYASLIGDQRRRREAMDNFVSDLLHCNSADLSSILKVSIERGWYKRIKQVLREYENKKELEIDKICFLHYAEFLGSITELMNMKGSTEDLRNRMTDLNKDFSSTGQDLSQIMIEIEKAQSERDVAQNAYQSAKECLEVSKLMIQIKDSLAQKNFHKAIGLLQIIQQNKSPLIKFMRDNILELSDNLAKRSTKIDVSGSWVSKISKSLLEVESTECDNFLIEIRRDASSIGTILMRKQAYIILKNVSRHHGLIPTATAATTPVVNTLPSSPSNKMDYEDNDPSVLLPITSYSLSYIYRFKQVFRLPVWSSPDSSDFEKCIPLNYVQCQSTVIKNKDSNNKKLNKYFEKAHPLYYAIHAFSTLNSLNEFYNHYRSERQYELDAKFDGARKSILKYGLCSSFTTLSAGLVGFFSLECMISRTLNLPSSPSSIVISTAVNAAESNYSAAASSVNTTTSPFSVLDIKQVLWPRACHKLKAVCSEFAAETVTSVDDMLSLKDDLLLMAVTMSDEAFLGINTDKLFDIMKALIEPFEALLIAHIKRKSEELFKTSLYQIYEVKTLDMYKKNIWSFGLDENSNEYMMFKDKKHKKKGTRQFTIYPSSSSSSVGITVGVDESFNSSRSIRSTDGSAAIHSSTATSASAINSNAFQPTKYLFSCAVPNLLREVYLLVVKYFLYVTKIKNLTTHGEAVCDCFQMVYETIAEELIHTLKSEDVRDTSIAKASQIAIDASTLASSSNSLWSMLEAALIHYRWSESLHMHIPKTILASKTCMNNVVLEAQDYLYEILGSKVDDLLTTMSFVDFLPRRVATECHAFVEEIVDYLRVTFLCLTNLPLTAIEAIHATCCRRVALGISTFLTSPHHSSSGSSSRSITTMQRINIKALRQFEIDVLKLQKFADECVVPHLRKSFSGLADLITAVLSHDLLSLVSAAYASISGVASLTAAVTGSVGMSVDSSHRSMNNSGSVALFVKFPNLNTNMLADLLEKVDTDDPDVATMIMKQQLTSHNNSSSSGSTSMSAKSSVPIICTLDAQGMKQLIKRLRAIHLKYGNNNNSNISNRIKR